MAIFKGGIANAFGTAVNGIGSAFQKVLEGAGGIVQKATPMVTNVANSVAGKAGMQAFVASQTGGAGGITQMMGNGKEGSTGDMGSQNAIMDMFGNIVGAGGKSSAPTKQTGPGYTEDLPGWDKWYTKLFTFWYIMRDNSGLYELGEDGKRQLNWMKIIIFGVVIVLLAVIIYFATRKKKSSGMRKPSSASRNKGKRW